MPGFIRATWPHCFTISSINTTANVLSPLQVITAAQVLTPCKCLHCCKYLGARSNTTLRILSVKGGGGTPQIRNPLFAENFVRKGGGGGGTPHIRNLFFGPKTGVFWAKNTIFSTFLRTFFGGMSVKGGGGVPPKSVTFFLAKILSVKGGGYPPYGQNPQSSI